MHNKAQMQAFLERYTGRDERFFSPMDTGDGGPVALQVRRSGLVWFGLVWFGLVWEKSYHRWCCRVKAQKLKNEME